MGSPITNEPSSPESGQIFPLHDYRWIQVIVKRVPSVIDCTYQVVSGRPTVHAELIAEEDFLKFRDHKDYDTIDESRSGRVGGFRHTVKTPGRYRVLLVNRTRAPEVEAILLVQQTPAPRSVSVGIPPIRRLTVILAAVALLFGTVTWSGSKLLRGYRNR